MIRYRSVPLLALLVGACAGAPPARVTPASPAGPSFEQKMAWILRLEDERVLRDPAPVVPPAPAPAKGRKAPKIAPPPPPPPPDLVRLLSDREARVQRRAALAVGRVGLVEGVDPLVALLNDPEPEVRQMAAFALGLIGDESAVAPLTAALGDASPLVEGSAAEALGLIGDASAAPAIGALVAKIVKSGAVAKPPAAEDEARLDTPAAAFRLGVFALARLKAYPPLAAAVLDQRGQPLVHWWPVAYALERLGDKRAFTALVTFLADPDPYARAFAAKGFGALGDGAAVPLLLPLVGGADRALAIEAVRALGRLGDPVAAAPLLKVVEPTKPDPHLRLEGIEALGHIHAPGVQDALLDSLGDPNPSIRAAALRAAAAYDPDEFVTVLSGLDADPNWSVRAALADALGTLRPDAALPRLTAMLGDTDQRVIPSALRALVKLKAPDATSVLLAHLKADDAVVRAAAAEGIGALMPPNGAGALAAAYRAGQPDATYVARAAALAALARYGAADARPLLEEALADKDWAVRVRAAALLKPMEPAVDVAARIRPAPTRLSADAYQAPDLVNPPVSTEIFIDTDKGTIRIELAVLDAPLTVLNFVSLAGKGFFNGLPVHRVVPDFVVQDGDPRGDGEGGPGYSIRDELNERPYLRGTVGMARDWPDTDGSQFFITLSPQPHLDARYTVFGRVTGGMEVLDAMQPWDIIRRVRVWNGNAAGTRD